MMSVEELKNHRDLAFSKLEKLSDRLKVNIQKKQARLIAKNLQDLKLLFEIFEDKHVAYLVKAKKDVTDQENYEIFSAAEIIVSDTEEIALLTLEEIQEEESQSQFNLKESERKLEFDKKKIRLKKEYEAEFGEVLQLMAFLSNKLCSPDDTVEHEPAVQELQYIEARFSKATEKCEQFIGMENDIEAWETAQSAKNKTERDYRDKFLEIKNLLHKMSPDVNENRSGANSRSGTVSLSSNEQSNFVRPRRMDYPKFDGKLRHFNTFKGDFEEIVVKNGSYTDEQLSHILRNYCLTGKLQEEVKNVFDYKKLWEKLDEDCHDEEEVVEEITREIHELKPVKEYDYTGFIQLVDLVEQADSDLNALNVTSVLNNKMTLRVVETRCPDWVIKPWISSREDPKIPPGERVRDFTSFLRFLCDKRKEAKKLMRLQENRKSQSNTAQVPQKQKKATVLAAAGEIVTESDKKSKDKKKFKCAVSSCSYQQKHYLLECRA